MGAEIWNFTANWDGGVDATLRRAQRETLARGCYGGHGRVHPPSTTLQDVREAYETDGSASVIDILELGSEPGPGVAGPFSDEVLLDIFGTTKPDGAAVLAKYGELAELLTRGDAAYVILYECQQPSAVLFLGCTAD